LFSLSSPRPPTPTHTLSLHDALPICSAGLDAIRCQVGTKQLEAIPQCLPCGIIAVHQGQRIEPPRADLGRQGGRVDEMPAAIDQDRKSTRLNSSHEWISYAVFCLKKK